MTFPEPVGMWLAMFYPLERNYAYIHDSLQAH